MIWAFPTFSSRASAACLEKPVLGRHIRLPISKNNQLPIATARGQ
jgi:hypothetical protein